MSHTIPIKKKGHGIKVQPKYGVKKLWQDQGFAPHEISGVLTLNMKIICIIEKKICEEYFKILLNCIQKYVF